MLLMLMLMPMASSTESTIYASSSSSIIRFSMFKFISGILPLFKHLHPYEDLSNTRSGTANCNNINILPPAIGRVRHEHSRLNFIWLRHALNGHLGVDCSEAMLDLDHAFSISRFEGEELRACLSPPICTLICA